MRAGIPGPTGEAFTPYCAAFVCWLVARAVGAVKVAFKLPDSARAFDFEKWGKANVGKGVQMVDPSATLEPGDIIVYTFSHVGIVEQRCARGVASPAVNPSNVERMHHYQRRRTSITGLGF